MNIHDFAEIKRCNLKQIMDFASTANPLGLSNKAKNAIRKGVKELSYPPDEKIRRLTNHICKKEGIDSDNITFGHDISHLLHVILQIFMPKTVLLCSPVSVAYEKIFHKYSFVDIITVPATENNSFKIDIEKTINCIRNVDMVVLPNPNDVTGEYLSEENLESLIREAERQDKLFVIDETYIEFIDSDLSSQSFMESPKTIILRTFSVFHALQGLPLAYGMASKELIKEIDYNIKLPQVNTLAYLAALASLKDKGYRERTKNFINKEKQFIKEKASKINCLDVFDTTCNFLLLKINQPLKDLKNLLMEKNILIDIYTDNQKNLYIRVPVKNHKYNARFIKTLKYTVSRSIKELEKV